MAKKRKRKNKRAASKEKKPFLPLAVTQKIWGVFLLLTSAVVALAFFDKAGAGGRGLAVLISFLVGKTIFILPLIFIIAGLMFFNSKFKNKWPAILAMLILIIGVSGVLGVLSENNNITEQRVGGWLGYIISAPLFSAFGIWVSLIIFAGLLITASLIVLQFLKPRSVKEKTDVLDSQEEKIEEPLISNAVVSEVSSQNSLIKKLFRPKFKIKTIDPSGKKDKKLESQDSKEGELREIARAPSKDEKKALLGQDSRHQLPPLNLLEGDKGFPSPGDIQVNSAIVKKTLHNFDIPVEMSEVNIGPTVTQYTLKPSEGVKLARITALSNDLALALSAHPIRIEAPIPGKPLVGIEMPNKRRVTVRLRNLFEAPNFRGSGAGLNLALGKDVSGAPLFADLTKMPHLLLAGATGTGKTIGLNSLILSLLYQQGPDRLKLILVDPKRVEFAVYQNLPHLLCPVIFEGAKTVNALKWLIGEMERRFEILSKVKSRNIISFNQVMAKTQDSALPYIVLVIDELADLMASKGKDVEANIVRLAQMARAVGIHLIVATQRPSVEVITGLIKANITSRVSFRVASQIDSRTVLDSAGAEKLLGLGDMLFLSPETKKPKRVQGAYVSEKEVRKVVNYLRSKASSQSEELPEDESANPIEDLAGLSSNKDFNQNLEQTLERGSVGSADDPLYQEAKIIVVESRRASASLLQRRLRIGYARAARLIDMLESSGVVGPPEGSKPREVYADEESSEDLGEDLVEPNNERV